MKVLYLFNKVRTGTDELDKIAKGHSNDNQFLGMLRVRKYDIETDYIEIEQFVPKKFATWLRTHLLNIWWIHLPLLPKMRRYDIVFTSTAYGSLFVRSILGALGIKVPKWIMIDFNISGTIGDATQLRQKMFKWAVSKCDGIVAISQAEEQTLREMFPHLADRIIFLYEGVDTNYYKPSEKPITEENYILSVGLDPSRDFGTLIEASRGLDIEVRLATKPERIAQFLPLPPNVTGKLYSRQEMPDLYAKAKIIVNGLNMKADNNDSMGTFSVADAMSMGKAVIVTKTRSMASYIEDGVTGVFVPVRDPVAMREAIRDLIQNDTKRAEIGRRAREFVVEHVDAEIFSRKLAEFFKKVYGQH
jgi:glycosyltransferase involved in cell wall biosynthesis